ncbi:HalOD1 output domain-containing protein [Halohasta litorea]|uniref:HalOD1 output domain-containing protein n=1 Tax=Halohasta litorea TaxID=869891 RepID=A0ABD6DCN4_9EURY
MTLPFDTDEEDTVSKRVINRVADVTGTDPLELEPLYYCVDPDCLNSIFENNKSTPSQCGGHVQFSMAGCQVIVNADGSVDVSTQPEEPDTVSPPSTIDTATDVSESLD